MGRITRAPFVRFSQVGDTKACTCFVPNFSARQRAAQVPSTLDSIQRAPFQANALDIPYMRSTAYGKTTKFHVRMYILQDAENQSDAQFPKQTIEGPQWPASL